MFRAVSLYKFYQACSKHTNKTHFSMKGNSVVQPKKEKQEGNMSSLGERIYIVNNASGIHLARISQQLMFRVISITTPRWSHMLKKHICTHDPNTCISIVERFYYVERKS